MMANTLTGFDGLTPPKVLPAVGSFVALIPFKDTISGITTSENLTFPQLTLIMGAIIQVLSNGNNVVTTDANITWATNVLTIADGTTFNLDATGQNIYGVVWGNAKL